MPSYETPPAETSSAEAPQFQAPQTDSPLPPPTAPGTGYPPPGPGYPPPGTGYPPGAGYGPPPGGYPPAGGFGAAPGGYAPPGYANSDEKTWALIAHFGGPVGIVVGGGLLGWLGPLIAMMGRGSQSPTVRAHAVAALNFQLTWLIALVASLVLMLISCGILFFLPIIAGIIPIVFGIIAGIKANEGYLYRYPMTINMVK